MSSAYSVSGVHEPPAARTTTLSEVLDAKGVAAAATHLIAGFH